MSYSAAGYWCGCAPPAPPHRLEMPESSHWTQAAAAVAADVGVFISGNVGTGKTTMLAWMERGLAAAHPAVQRMGRKYWLKDATLWTTAAVYCDDLRDGWERKKHVTDWGDHLSPDGLARSTARLFIDDLGAEAARDGNLDFLAEMIAARHAAQRPLWVSTNLSADEISKRYGARTLSRLMDMCARIEIPGGDRRTWRKLP